jgi:hypothetical protein
MKARKLADNVWQLPPREGPSEAFVKLTRNPKLASPARFEPTEKGPNDVII